MRFIVNRDFREYAQHPEWVSLEEKDLSKSKWKRFNTKSYYLDSIYPAAWRIIFSFKNLPLSNEDTVVLLKKSLGAHFSNEESLESLVENIQLPTNVNYKKKDKGDSIHSFTANLLIQALKEYLAEKDFSFGEQVLQEFLETNADFTYTIPFVEPNAIIQTTTQKNPWLPDSLESFLRNNLLIQVKRTTLESEGNGIAIFLRKDLKLGKGKSGAQLSHGAVSLLHQPMFKSEFHDKFMVNESKTILIYTVKDLKDIKEIEHLCLSQKVNHSLISDAGHTQIAPGTMTTIAVGPIPKIWLQILAYNIEAVDLNS